jgi:CspA family cold shock protein
MSPVLGKNCRLKQKSRLTVYTGKSNVGVEAVMFGGRSASWARREQEQSLSERAPSWKDTFMASGKVKWFDNKRGFGFIAQSSGKDVFVHHSAIQGRGYKTLSQGEWVTFDLVDSGKGPKATKVERLRPSDAGGATASAATDWRPPKPHRSKSHGTRTFSKRYTPNKPSSFPSTDQPPSPTL